MNNFEAGVRAILRAARDEADADYSGHFYVRLSYLLDEGERLIKEAERQQVKERQT